MVSFIDDGALSLHLKRELDGRDNFCGGRRMTRGGLLVSTSRLAISTSHTFYKSKHDFRIQSLLRIYFVIHYTLLANTYKANYHNFDNYQSWWKSP